MRGLKPIYTQADFLENQKPLQIESSSRTLLKFRLWFYAISLAHFLIIGMIALPIDFTASHDPHVRRMSFMKHLLVTAWTNYLVTFYLPLCLYVDWHELKGLHFESKIKKLNKLRHFVFMSFINPTTMYSCNFFWRVFILDREQLVPTAFDEYIPMWMQHSLHTVPMLVCLVELCAVPRFKPHTSYYHKLAMKIFFVVYLIPAMIVHDRTGHFPYPFFVTLTPLWLVIFFTDFYLENLYIYHTQWLVTDLIWGSRLDDEILKENTKQFIDIINNTSDGKIVNTVHKSA